MILLAAERIKIHPHSWWLSLSNNPINQAEFCIENFSAKPNKEKRVNAVSEANNLRPVKNPETGEFYPGRPITPEMCKDLQRIFRLLIDAGADRNNLSAFSKKSIRPHYENEPVWQICGNPWV